MKKNSEKLQRWLDKLSYTDREKIRELIFRLYSLSEEMRMDRNKKGKNE